MPSLKSQHKLSNVFDVFHSNVDPGLINPSHSWVCVPSKSDESPLKRGHPLLINQGFIHPGLTLIRLVHLLEHVELRLS